MLNKIVIIVLILIFMPSIAFAQSKQISIIGKGQTAPFAGVLLSPAAYAELDVNNSINQALSEAKIAYALDLNNAEWEMKLNNEKTERKFEGLMYQERLRLKESEIERLEDMIAPTFWENWDFEFGIVGGILFSMGTFWVHGTVNESIPR